MIGRRLGGAWFALLTGLCWTVAVNAHEVRPGYLELTEREHRVFDVVWKQPLLGETRLPLEPRLPTTCCSERGRQEVVGGALVERLRLTCESGIDGGTIAIDGLEQTLTDVLLRVTWRDGRTFTAMLRPDAPTIAVGASAVGLAGYLQLGFEHLLTGVDHVLFVLALLLLVRGGWPLVGAITAFTVAHSITLAASVLDVVRLPQTPVEATIALSIVFIAAEVLRPRDLLLQRFPWLIAFIFGLLHGFGFAGALREIGLPQDTLGVALLLFNLGIEAGQLFIVGAALVLVALLRRIRRWRGLFDAHVHALRATTAYGIGAVAMFWTIERTLGRWWLA